MKYNKHDGQKSDKRIQESQMELSGTPDMSITIQI